MDPNACLKEIDRILAERDETCYDIIDGLCEDLIEWIYKGGFDPDWEAYSLGAGYYRCRKIHYDQGERVQ